MKLFKTIFSFEGNSPSVCDIPLGESYDDFYDVVSCVQEKHTGDFRLDLCLDEYGVFVDVSIDEDECISEIEVSFYPYSPFDYNEMRKIYSSLMDIFDYTRKIEHTDETFIDDELEYEYSLELMNDSYKLAVKKDSYNPKVTVILSSFKKNI